MKKILLYNAACYHFCQNLVVVIFFRKLCLPWHSVHHSQPAVHKCNNVRDPYQVSDFGPPNSLDLSYKIWDSESTRKSLECEWFEVESDWCVNWSGTERYWRWQWSVVQTSLCLHLSHKKTFWIFTVTKLAKTKCKQCISNARHTYVITALVRKCNDTWFGFDQLVSHFCWSYNSNFCHNISKLLSQRQKNASYFVLLKKDGRTNRSENVDLPLIIESINRSPGTWQTQVIPM